MSAHRVIAGLLALLISSLSGHATERGCQLLPGPVHSVARVVDGETLVLDDGTTVRLVGILAPRAEDADGDPDMWMPAQQARASLENAVSGRTVAVAMPRPRDRYDRLPAHLLILDGPQPVWLQRVLVEAGAVRVAPPVDGDACGAALLQAEADARSAARGLWSQPVYLPLSAGFAPRLYQRRNTFQIVVGHVAHVSTLRGATYLGFGRDWRTDFTILVSQPVRRRLLEQGVDVANLQGALVEVRGWMERRNGPLINLLHPENLRVLTGGK